MLPHRTLSCREIGSRDVCILFALVFLSCMFFSALRAATAQTLHPTFEVATVKLAPPQAYPNTGSWSLPGIGRFTATHVSLALLLQLAYGVDSSQISNKPDWLGTNPYDIDARPEEGVSLTPR